MILSLLVLRKIMKGQVCVLLTSFLKQVFDGSSVLNEMLYCVGST